MTKQYKILLVEDEPDIAEIYSIKLAVEGFNVLVASNGAVAIEKIKEESPDLTLLDLVMPDTDGYEALKLIRKEKLASSMLIYIWSNLTQAEEIEKAKKLGANGYLIKSDYTPSKLAELIKKIFKK